MGRIISTDFYYIKCLPLDRSWPGEKCHRCAVYNYACSASMTASQDKQLQQGHTATSLMPPPPRPTQSSVVDSITYDSQQSNHRLIGEKPDDKPSWPKCAPYFSLLIKSSWDFFGRPSPSETASSDIRLMATAAAESHKLNCTFKNRLFNIDLCRRYQGIIKENITCGISQEDSRAFTCRRMAYEAAKYGAEGARPDGMEVIQLALSIESSLAMALRWQSLVDAVGVPEVLLIQYGNVEPKYWKDLPLPNVTSASDEEWPSLLQTLLSPALGLKETCLKLSGIIDMIERLEGLEESDLRTYLVTSIRKRVESVLGTEKNFPYVNVAEEDDDEEDDSMADFE